MAGHRWPQAALRGEVRLGFRAGGSVLGEYRDFTTGSVVPMTLTR